MIAEAHPSPGRRLLIFIRSVLPAEPAQLLLLAGATFLFISPELRWWPELGNASLLQRLSPSQRAPSIFSWALVVRSLGLLIVAAGALGYFACFRRLLRNSVRTLLLILACALAGVLSICCEFYFVLWGRLSSAQSVFELLSSRDTSSLQQLGIFLADLGPGLRFASTGMVLVAIFAILVWTNRATLPLHLTAIPLLSESEPVPSVNPRDLAVFVPAMIGLMPLLTILQILVTSPIFLVTPGRLSHAAFKWIVGLQDVEGAMLLAAFVLVAIGKGRKEIIYPCFRLPSVYYAALAVMLATVVFQVWPIVSYVQDRHAWAAIRWVVIQPPQFLSYFGLPQPRMLWLLIPALVEEFAWRGYLQPIFIRRYGLLRGIFLVSVAWGAFHFSSDFRSSMTDVQVLFGIATRIGVTVALGYVLAWITIRSESIVPAALLHGIYNVFIYSSLPTQAPVWFLAVVLGLLGYILFRYWPPVVPVDSAQPDLVAEPDPAI